MINYKNSNNIDAIVKQIKELIESGNLTDSDLEGLRQALGKISDQSIQLGKYNVLIDEANNLHIGDRIYYSWDEEALNALVQKIQFSDPDEVHLLVTKLNNARLQGEEGDRKTGSFYTYEIWLEDVSLEDSQDLTEGDRHIQKYIITGKWDSRVYKEINAFGVRVDTPWGHKKKPNGQFTATVEILNGRATLIKVHIAHYNDSANNYAAEKTRQFIETEITKILRVV